MWVLDDIGLRSRLLLAAGGQEEDGEVKTHSGRNGWKAVSLSLIVQG